MNHLEKEESETQVRHNPARLPEPHSSVCEQNGTGGIFILLLNLESVLGLEESYTS